MAEDSNGVGHNSNGSGDMTDEAQEALFHSNLGRVRRLKEKHDAVVSELRNAFKQAKADGFSKREIDYALRLEKDEDGEMLQQRRREALIAWWLQHPIGTQNDLFADEPDRQPLDEKNYNEGRRAGMEGVTCKPPEGIAHPEKWIEGWHAGQDALKASSPLTAAGHAELVRKRGRPRGSTNKPRGITEQLQQQNDAVEEQVKNGTLGDQPATHQIVQ